MKKIIVLILIVLCVLMLTAIFSSCSDSDSSCTHEFKQPKTLREPTCTEVGYSFTECALCKMGTVELIHHTGGHKEEIIPAVEGDCYTEGFTEGARCTVCGEITVEPKSLGEVEHTFSGGICVLCGANQSSDGLEFILNYDKESYSLKSVGKCQSESIIVPATYEGKPITNIVDEAFKGCKTVKSIEVPSSVVAIGKGAFAGCDNLTKLVLPFVGSSYNESGIASQATLFGYVFGDSSTDGTYGIKQYISKSESYIAYIPKNLSNVRILNGTLYYGTFQGVSSLVTLDIGGNATFVGENAFRGCTKLSELYLPQTVMAIEQYAFHTCSALTEIDISRVNSLGQYAFANCSKLESVTVAEGIIELYEATFLRCASLKSVTLPSTIEIIGPHVFQECTGLSAINLPKGLTTIDMYAFSKCSALPEINLPDTVSELGEYAFYSCTGATSVTLNEGLKILGDKLFYGCSALKSISIPSSVSAFGEDMFVGCTSLNELIIDDNNPDFASVDGILYSKDLKTLILYTPGRAGESFEIPYHVEKIASYAFYENAKLKNIIIPENVVELGENAFANATALKSVTIPSSIKAVANKAFSGCESLEAVTFGEGVEKIGDYAFYNTGLKELTIPEHITEIGKYSFAKNAKLTKIVIPSSIKKINEASFSNCSALEDITMADGVQEIGKSAFSNCTGLKSVNIGKGVTTIGGFAFNKCSSLTNVYIPISVITIGEGAFYQCPETGLISVEAEEAPSGWNEKWNYSKVPVLWGATE